MTFSLNKSQWRTKLAILTCSVSILASCAVQAPQPTGAPPEAQSATDATAMTDPVLSRPAATERPYYATTVSIEMRDGVELVGNLVLPGHGQPAPIILAISPYGRHGHALMARYAQAGLGFLFVDARGRNGSGGEFEMFYGDLNDTIDTIEWAAAQPFSNGQISMWGSSYSGYNQWMAAAKGTDALVSITPGASVYPGWDYPMVNQVGYPYASIWTAFTKGRTTNFQLFNDHEMWRGVFVDFLASGLPFSELDKFTGFDSDLFDLWVANPAYNDYWAGVNPSAEEMAAIDLPILSMTGLYDGAQIGALRYYKEHMASASEEAKAQHYLVIGPYDHEGVVFPRPSVGGLDVPEAGGIVPTQLHGEWYGWTMAGGPQPSFLKDRFMYYVMGDGANEWRSAPSLNAVPIESTVFYLHGSDGSSTSVDEAGMLSSEQSDTSELSYVYDPIDISKAGLAVFFQGDFILSDADIQAIDGEALIFETEAFAYGAELIGQPKFEALIGIDTPDTDFQMRVYEITADGASVYLSESRARARYRESLAQETLITDDAPKPYIFEDFTFASRRLQPGSKLRFVFGAPNSIYIQRHYNSGKPVAEQTPDDAKTATVTLITSGPDAARLTLPIERFSKPEEQ